MTEATLYDARACELGEGPLWHPERKQLFWFDIVGHRLLSRDGDTPLEWAFDECCSAAGWVDHDTLLIATETGLYRFNLATGARDLITPLEADQPDTRSNDGRADPMGGFWIGTMGKAAEANAGAIYRFYNGELRKLHDRISISNSICFAPGGRTAYWTDTPTQVIMAQALDDDGWPVEPARPFLDLNAVGLRPDGSVVDAEGGLWNAQWGSGRVSRYTADGTFDSAVTLPGKNSTCPAFGGPELSTLFITSAMQGLSEPDDAQGRVYVADVGIRGLPEAQVRLS